MKRAENTNDLAYYTCFYLERLPKYSQYKFLTKKCRKTAYINFRPIRSQHFKFVIKKINVLKIRTIWCITHASILNGCRNTANISFWPKNAEKTAYINFRPIRSQHFKFAVKNETRWKYERFGVLHMLLSWTVAEIQPI